MNYKLKKIEFPEIDEEKYEYDTIYIKDKNGKFIISKDSDDNIEKFLYFGASAYIESGKIKYFHTFFPFIIKK